APELPLQGLGSSVPVARLLSVQSSVVSDVEVAGALDAMLGDGANVLPDSSLPSETRASDLVNTAAGESICPGAIPQAELDIDVLERAAAQFRFGVTVTLPEDQESCAASLSVPADTEDVALIDLAGPESLWWNQVRDSDPHVVLQPASDPLEGHNVDFEATFRSACQVPLASSDLEALAQPWDEGVFGVIFGGKDFLDLPVKKAARIFIEGEAAIPVGASEAAAKRARRTSDDVSFSKVVKAQAIVDWKQQRSEQLAIGLDMWLCMVLQWGPCLLVSQLDACSSREDQIEVLGDIMKGKAPSTVLKRARSLTLLHDFVREKSATFPCAESHVYDFLKTLEREGAPPSRLSSVLEAINFTLHVVGVSELADVSSSRRCKGICTSEFFKEPNQASPLTVQQLQTLHDVLESHPDQWCRAFAGAALVCAYSRCRWSDVQHTETILWDIGFEDDLCYIELRIGHTETLEGVQSGPWDHRFRLLLQVEDGDTRIASKSMKVGWTWCTVVMLKPHCFVKEVRDGSFRPDDTRSGRLLTERAQPLVSSFVPEVGGIGGPSVIPQASDVSRVQECKSELGEECSAGEPIVVDSESEPGASPGESSDESDEDDGQPIALVAQGLVVPAAFLQRCSEVSSDGSLHAALVAQGIRNFRQLAFAIGTPRVEPSAQQYSDLATQVFGASPALGKIAILRDLHFEAKTYVIQVFKEQATSDTADVQIKRLPLPERTARALDQQRRLSGVAITGELQPKRDAEVAIGITEKSPVVHLEKDALKLTAPQPKIPVDLSSPLNLMWAWQRRGIAMDQCGLLSWAVHEQYVQRLLNLLTAPVPSHCSPVRTEQLIRADKEVWTLLAREVQPPYKPLPTGIKPLDPPFTSMMFDQRIQVWLTPVASTNVASASGAGAVPEVPDLPTPHGPQKTATKKKIRKKARALMPESFEKCPRFSKGPVCWAHNGEGTSDASSDPGEQPAVKNPRVDTGGGSDSLGAPARPTATEAEHLNDLIESLSQKTLCSDDILRLFDALPKSPSPRQSDGKGQSFAAGSFVHGGAVGLHSNTMAYAGAVRLICNFLSAHMKGVPFTSFIFLDQCQSSLHVDANNEPQSWNIIVPISSFQGGGVWYQAEDGDVVCPHDSRLKGKILPVDKGPQWLAATRDKHCTLSWSGRRCVLVGYNTRFADHLKAHEICALKDLGFSLSPAVSTGEPMQIPPSLQVQDMLVIELCCGPVAISHACGKIGFQTLALDRKPASSSVRVLTFDLLCTDSVAGLTTMLKHEASRVAMVWARVPHSTSTPARERPLPQLRGSQLREPKPLRTSAHPDGVPGLCGADKRKLETANLVFESVCLVLRAACLSGIRCVIENHQNSLFWQTSFFRALQALSPQSCWVPFHMCAHGGDRPKPCKLWTSSHFLDALQLTCPGESEHHVHTSWKPVSKDGRFSQAISVYPSLFCQRVAGLLRDSVVKEGASEATSLSEQQIHTPPVARVPLGLQPTRSPGVLPEFGYYVHVIDYVQNSEPTAVAPPKGHFISRHLSTWGDVQAEKRVAAVGLHCRVSDPQPGTRVEVFRFGIPLAPDKFVQRAVRAGHPRDFVDSLEPALKSVVKENLLGDEFSLAKHRLKFIARWSARAKELQGREDALHAALPPHIRQTLKGKRLLLWQELILAYGLPDTSLIEDMQKGFSLSGWLPASQAFPTQIKRPEFSLETLKLLSGSLNKAVLEKMAVRQEPLLEHATWQATLDELQSGWIWEAPKFEEDFKVYARRFGIVQGDKTRVIDDCSCCGLNATVGTVEKFVVQAIDRMAATLSYAIDISTEGGAPLCGRTYDLKSAYKQFPVSCADRDILRMFVNRPGQAEPSSVGLNALPFGAIGSVAAFLRISMSVLLGVLALRVIWTAFFDDYSVVSKEGLKQNTAFAVQSLFNLLGLDYAKEGKKAPEFSGVFQMLGLVVDLSQFESRLVKIGHTDKRIAELMRSLDGILEEDRLSAKEAERLRGRMNFFEGHAFGRGPTQAVRNLDRQARVGLLKQGLTGDAKTSLGVLRSRLLSARPLEIGPKFSKTWYLFTDGAFENGKGSVGAIFYDQSGVARGAFGARAPDAFMHRALEYSRNPIYELELMPVLLAFRVWQKVFRCGQLVVYVDNEAAKAALIRACASTPVAELVTESVRLLEESLQLRCWYSRVPSLSNPADAPSRLCFDGIDPSIIVEAASLQWDVLSSVGRVG
ncbi:kptA, partial [Symbiodinium sp. CCMP2592]